LNVENESNKQIQRGNITGEIRGTELRGADNALVDGKQPRYDVGASNRTLRYFTITKKEMKELSFSKELELCFIV